jgi:serine/threonine protein kinase
LRDPPKIDRYEILGQLGKGANGLVYLGKDTRLSREVAIKVVNPDLVKDPVVLSRFHREAKAVAKLHHPNIIQLLDYSGPNSKQPYLVVERLHGKNLDDLVCERKEPLDAASAAAAAHEICLGLQHAHSLGLVHRDLKPENVFVEPEGRIVICDFGIARSFEPDATGTLASSNTRLAGSPLYMSPEQITTPQTVGPPSDMFALGSLLYFLVTGQHAFMTDTVVNVLKRIVAGKPDDLRTTRPGLPDRYYRVVEKLFSVQPEKRYTSAQAIADSLLLIVKESGASDPRRALQAALQKLGHTTGSMSKSQIVALEDLDEESKTVVGTLTGRTVIPVERAKAEGASKPAPKPSVTPLTDSNVDRLLAHKRSRSLNAPRARSNTTTWIVVSILAAAILVSLVLVLTAKRKHPHALALPAPAAPQVAATGTLRLFTVQTVDVYIDDRKIGSSASMGPVPLPPGVHTLRVMHPKLGKHEEQFAVQAGRDTTINVDLQR